MEDIVEEPIVDIDSSDINNPIAVVDYVEDLYAFYKKMEVSLVSIYHFQFSKNLFQIILI